MHIKNLALTALVILLAGACGNNNSKSTGTVTASPVISASEPAEETAPAPGNLVEVDPDRPSIALLSKGSIIPSSGKLDLLFRSEFYGSAQVRVRRIYKSNVLQYMQYDRYELNYSMDKIGKVIADTTIVLNPAESSTQGEEKIYALRLDKLIRPEPGSIYRVEIKGLEPTKEEEENWESDAFFGAYSTYEDRHADLMASDLALLAKGAEGHYEVFVFNLVSGRSVKGAKVTLYNYAQQAIASAYSASDGKVEFNTAEDCSFVSASYGKDASYLDIRAGKSLSTSNFDVSGTTHENGLKAYIFGERGVWRPGDEMHITAIAMNEGKQLPAGHPVTAKLYNPFGQVVNTLTVQSDGGSIWHFPFTTEADAPTGRWRVEVILGGQSFSKSLRVETVKPNKLDMTLDFGQDVLEPSALCVGELAVRWLYGAVGSGLKVDAQLEISPAKTSFKGYEAYDFTDDTRTFNASTSSYGTMVTDSEGHCHINLDTKINKSQAPGMLEAGFNINAYEPSGEFSTSYFSFPLSPFSRFVGMKTKMDKSEWSSNLLFAGKNHTFDVVCLDKDGKPQNATLIAGIYHVDWSWWWNSSSQVANYMSGSSKETMMETIVTTKAGKGSFSYDWKDAPGGLYFVRVSDDIGGHATSMLVEVQDGESASAASDGFTALNISGAKDSYQPGETARLVIPSADGASALISIEKGGKILQSRKVSCTSGKTEIQIPISADMAPNAYAFVTLIQPHSNTANDAPIRMYGVQNLNVQDPKSHLNPVVDAPAQTKPESALRIKVKEKNGRAMSYVVAVVDEGLLSLTGFKTPDAWKSFYAKEALRVRTWDLYDNVIGAYGGKIEQLFAIGGDDEAAGPIKKQGAERFTPVVAYLGPFSIKAGKTATHDLELPQYIGNLRVMVVATDGKAQGSTQANVEVTRPVMVQATMPRTVCTSEIVKVPATLMTLKEKVGTVKLSIRTDGLFEVVGPASISVNSNAIGQQVEYFQIKTGTATGIGHVSVTAESAADKSVSEIEIDVLNANPSIKKMKSIQLASGEQKEVPVEFFGAQGTDGLEVEFSSIPAVNLNGRLSYLTEYPYGCVEQVTSAAFPQLYIGKVMKCDEAFQARCSRNVTAAIRRLQTYLRSDGLLNYWPGYNSVSNFGSVYALHFLLEAENNGYAVPGELKETLLKNISAKIASAGKDQIAQAYACYVLAAAGKPARSAMNLLREKINTLPCDAGWFLAAAYSSDGKKDVAQKLISGLTYENTRYDVFGSRDRNLAIALRVCQLCGMQDKAFELAQKVAAGLNDSSRYMSTQTTAWSLMAICTYASQMNAGGIKASVGYDGKTIAVTGKECIAGTVLKPSAKADKVLLKNGSGVTLNAVVCTSGAPEAGKEKAASSGLSLKVSYFEEDGSAANVDTLSQGRRITAVVTVTNTGADKVENIALNHRFPSGWEIQNNRLNGNSSAPAGITWQDIRDDRVCSFFDLGAGSSVTVSTKLIASYPGTYYLPAISCEAMYDGNISAQLPGRWISVLQK